MYVEAQILFHLNQVGVLEHLSRGGSHTSKEIAEALQLDPAGTDALLDYVFEVDELLDRDANGSYRVSEFGQALLDRYSDKRPDSQRLAINMFDVRVGAYGPVWRNLSGLLRGQGRYGESVHRDGRYAESGVSTLAMKFWDSLTQHIDEVGGTQIVEIGLTTGLLERLADHYGGHLLYGLDRSHAAIERGAASVTAQGITNVAWLHRDFFDIEGWAGLIDRTNTGVVYSLHFHELLAAGEGAFVEALRELKARLPNWVVVALEQPKLSHDEKASVPETQWLYSQSNVLIHHLIGNGRIFSRDAWTGLGYAAGCREVTDRACNYLGYRAFAFRL